MTLSKLSKKEKIGLIIALLILTCALLDRMVINPINTRFRGLSREIGIAEKQLGRHLRNLMSKGDITKRYAKYVMYVKKIGSDEEDVAKVLAEIEALARRSGVSLSDIKPKTPKDISFYKQYTVEVEANGDMNSIVHFLYQLNSSNQLLRAEKLRLSMKERESSSVVKASVLITQILIPWEN